MKKVIIYIVIFAMLLISLVFVNSYVKAISKEQRFNDCPYNEKYPICQQDGNCIQQNNQCLQQNDNCIRNYDRGQKHHNRMCNR